LRSTTPIDGLELTSARAPNHLGLIASALELHIT